VIKLSCGILVTLGGCCHLDDFGGGGGLLSVVLVIVADFDQVIVRGSCAHPYGRS
jgi:hypothetical protein